MQAWSTGADGEERTAAFFAPLEAEGFIVVHDLKMPMSMANIDHVVVGPPGVFVVETKSYAGRLRVRGGELRLNGRKVTKDVAQAQREAAAVAAMVAPNEVTALVCVHRAELPWRKIELAGVRVVGPKELVGLLRSAPVRLEAGEIQAAAERLGWTSITVSTEPESEVTPA